MEISLYLNSYNFWISLYPLNLSTLVDAIIIFTYFSNTTLHEVLGILEEDNEIEATEIFIEPPEPNVNSDQDSGEEDEGGFVNNLSGRQLNAKCEIRFTQATDDNIRARLRSGGVRSTVYGTLSLSGDVAQADNVSGRSSVRSRGRCKGRGASSRGTFRDAPKSTVNEPDSSCNDSNSTDEGNSDGPTAKKKKTNEKQHEKVTTWEQADIKTKASVFPESDYSRFRDKNPVQIFEMFFDDEVINLLLAESERYALFLNCPNPNITREEMKTFIAVLILSGYCSLPGRDYFWDQRDDMRNTMVYNSIRRDRFRTIMRFLHFADNTRPDLHDKMWKLNPLINLLKKKFSDNFVASAEMDYDESMIKYFGKHGCKQFIRGKPIRFGFKVWCLNSTTGYLQDFIVYQGAHGGRDDYDKEVGKCASPLLAMLDKMREDVEHLPFRLYFDNLFTSFPLIFNLQSRGYEGTGTVRENRLPKNIPITDKKSMQKRPRGSHCFVSDKDNNIIVVRWMDNSVVTAISSVHGVSPMTNISRYSRVEKKIIQVSRPAIFTEYNKSMGGTDLMDENINRYRIGIRSKKWWWCIWTYLIDVSIVNAWIQMKQAGSQIPQLAFRREIVQVYLKTYASLPRGPGRISSSKSSATGHKVSDEIRYDGTNHLLTNCAEGVRRRCANESCSSRTRTECIKCDVGLCVTCNFTFHTKK